MAEPVAAMAARGRGNRPRNLSPGPTPRPAEGRFEVRNVDLNDSGGHRLQLRYGCDAKIGRARPVPSWSQPKLQGKLTAWLRCAVSMPDEQLTALEAEARLGRIASSCVANAPERPNAGRRSRSRRKRSCRRRKRLPTPTRSPRPSGRSWPSSRRTSRPVATWLYEVKFDGYRILTRFERGKPQIFTRRGHDWTDRMPALADELATLGIDSGWVDGEIVVLNEQRRHRLQRLAERVRPALDGADRLLPVRRPVPRRPRPARPRQPRAPRIARRSPRRRDGAHPLQHSVRG